MIVQKLLQTHSKDIVEKPAYKKPVHKSYRQLLQLDRPRKKIQYVQSDQQQDFLQKILNQEKKNTKKKRKTSSRKNTSQSAGRSKPQKVSRQSGRKQRKNKQKAEQKQQKKKEKVPDEIQMFLAQTKQQKTNNDLQTQHNNPQQKTKYLQSTKSKSLGQLKSFNRGDKSKIIKKDIAMSNPIFIDTKSLQSPPIVFTSANHLFNNTITAKNQTNAYYQLIKQKDNYQRAYKTPIVEHCKDFVNEKIQHKIGGDQLQNYSFHPNIKPLNSNWRVALTFNPLAGKQQKHKIDRKKLFKNDQEEERFIQSLRQLSRYRK